MRRTVASVPIWLDSASRSLATGAPLSPVFLSPSTPPSAGAAASFATYQLLTWGRGDHGNLGHGRRETRWEPKAVEWKQDQPDVLHDPATSAVPPPVAACGFTHTIARLNEKVMAFGKGGGGRLGCGRDTDIEYPQEVLFPAGVQPVQLSCGGIHSAAVDSLGRLWTWGFAGMGSLGAVERKGSFFGTLLGFVQGQHRVKLVWPHESYGPWTLGEGLGGAG
jgi:hypothetical protein